jgi:putative spermidine/putrescine transport system ATP-binding protein
MSAASPPPRAGRRVEVERVWKSYDGKLFVVRDVSFVLEPGEFLTLLGPSGSGKTTTLMMIAGFEPPSRGRVRVDGRDIAAELPEQRNFGIVFQGYALFPHMSALDNVAFPLRMRGVETRRRQRQAAEMLEKVGLLALSGRRPHELSGGQQQRVALARALVFAPDALLLDEPLGALDRKLREQLQIEIKELQRRIGVSVLLVTHDQDEAMMMSDRIAVMDKGSIAQIGAPADVYLHPVTPFVATFLGETNLLPGTCRGAEGDHLIIQLFNGALGRARIPRFGGRPGAGDAVLAAIRPERMRILKPGEAADSCIEGRIVSFAFLGRHARYVIEADNQTVVVSTPDWSEGAALAPQTRVRLGWLSDDAQGLIDAPGGADRWRAGAGGEEEAIGGPRPSPKRACASMEKDH